MKPFCPPIYCPLVSFGFGTPRLFFRDMHNTLCDLSTIQVLDDSSSETLNDSRSTINSDSVVSASETLNETPKKPKEPCKSYPLPVGHEEGPPELPFRLLFFAHFGWGPKLSPELRSTTNSGQPYFIVPRLRCFWRQLTPYVYESLSGVHFIFDPRPVAIL